MADNVRYFVTAAVDIVEDFVEKEGDSVAIDAAAVESLTDYSANALVDSIVAAVGCATVDLESVAVGNLAAPVVD